MRASLICTERCENRHDEQIFDEQQAKGFIVDRFKHITHSNIGVLRFVRLSDD